MTARLAVAAVLFAAPLVVVAAARLDLATEKLRRIAVLAGAAMSLAALVLLAWTDDGCHRFLAGTPLLRVDGFTAVLLPIPAVTWLATVAVTPRSRLDRAGLSRTAWTTLGTTAAFATRDPWLLWLLWSASTVAFLSSLARPETLHARGVAAAYLLSSVVLLGVGVGLVFGVGERVSWAREVGLWTMVVAILIRKGIFPLHAWVPHVFERGRLGPSVLFSAPQLGSYAFAVLVFPHATPAMLRTVAVLSLVTAVYGAAVAVCQRDARRACGYLFVSQSALVLAGLEGTSPEAIAGALVVWLASAVAFTGIARCILVLEVRRGRLALTTFHGGYEQFPHLATSFLGFGLACIGFPGTLGFAGEELLVQGTVGAFPLLGFAVVVASALTGFTVLRMYFSFFCGRRVAGSMKPLLSHELLVFGALAVFLVAAGLLPERLVSSRLTAAHALLEQRTQGAARCP